MSRSKGSRYLGGYNSASVYSIRKDYYRFHCSEEEYEDYLFVKRLRGEPVEETGIMLEQPSQKTKLTVESRTESKSADTNKKDKSMKTDTKAKPKNEKIKYDPENDFGKRFGCRRDDLKYPYDEEPNYTLEFGELYRAGFQILENICFVCFEQHINPSVVIYEAEKMVEQEFTKIINNRGFFFRKDRDLSI